MKILTTVKKVVDVELNMRVKDGALIEEGMQYVINAWDENAVETAVQLKESIGAETTLVLSLIHISEPTRPFTLSRMPSSA